MIPVSRQEFNDAISNLILQTELAAETALNRTDVSIKDVTDVILVGGSTRIPAKKRQKSGKEAKLFGNLMNPLH